MTAFNLIVCVLIFVPAFILFTVPDRLITSINRGCLWKIRDNIFDARRKGDLPDSSAVEWLINQAEAYIVVGTSLSALQIWWLKRKMQNAPSMPEPVLNEMSAEELNLFCEFRQELGLVMVRQYFTGSWSGLVAVAPRHVPELRYLLTLNHRIKKPPTGTASSTPTLQSPPLITPDRTHEERIVRDLDVLIPGFDSRRELLATV